MNQVPYKSEAIWLNILSKIDIKTNIFMGFNGNVFYRSYKLSENENTGNV